MPRPSPPTRPGFARAPAHSRPSCTCSGVASRRPLSSCSGLSSHLSFPTLCASGSHPRRAGVTACTCACRGRQEGAYGERTAARLISSVRSTPHLRPCLPHPRSRPTRNAWPYDYDPGYVSRELLTLLLPSAAFLQAQERKPRRCPERCANPA